MIELMKPEKIAAPSVEDFDTFYTSLSQRYEETKIETEKSSLIIGKYYDDKQLTASKPKSGAQTVGGTE